MSEIHGATGSYVLHALDPSELDEFEAHLAVCPTCSREVVEFCETAAELSLLATAPPPPALKNSIMSAIGGVRVLPPLPAQPPLSNDPPPLPVNTAPPTPPAAATALGTRATPVDDLALRRARRTTRLLSLAVAAALVVALALGGWVADLVQRQDAQIAATTAETQLLSAPDVKTLPVALPNGGQISFVASKSLNRAMLTSSQLPTPGPGRTWQLWTLVGDLQGTPRPVPDVTLDGGTSVRQFFTTNVAAASGVAISNEPAGGSSTPSRNAVVAPL